VRDVGVALGVGLAVGAGRARFARAGEDMRNKINSTYGEVDEFYAALSADRS
jgi:hypothetical protein